jgi:uridine monophosphate synthetase
MNSKVILSLALLTSMISAEMDQCLKEHMMLEFGQMGGVMEGSFELRTGIPDLKIIPSPVYIDVKRIISNPSLFEKAIIAAGEMLDNFTYDYISAPPYGSLPLASAVAAQYKQPLLLLRKESKAYGACKLIEGNYQKGERVLLIEDVIVSGRGVWEACEQLRKEGLVVTDVITILDRQQGGPELLAKHGITVHAILTMTEMVDFLNGHGMLKENTPASIRSYIQKYRF